MPLKKNISPSNENKQLLELFKAHFQGDMNLARIRLICLFISALCKVRSVNFTKIAVGFDTKVDTSSNYRRIQRFMAQVDLPMKWVASFIFNLLPEKDSVVLVMDRTNWKFGKVNINILILGVSYKNVTFPLMFKMLDKRGNSNTVERIALVKSFIDWFGKNRIDCLLADREFVGAQWLEFLNDNQIRYPIRIRNNFKVFCSKRQTTIPAFHLFYNLKTGQLRHYEKIVKVNGQYCYLSGMKTIKDGKPYFCIVVSFNKPEQALSYYQQR